MSPRSAPKSRTCLIGTCHLLHLLLKYWQQSLRFKSCSLIFKAPLWALAHLMSFSCRCRTPCEPTGARSGGPRKVGLWEGAQPELTLPRLPEPGPRPVPAAGESQKLRPWSSRVCPQSPGERQSRAGVDWSIHTNTPSQHVGYPASVHPESTSASSPVVPSAHHPVLSWSPLSGK